MRLTGDFLFVTELALAYSVSFISLVTSHLFDGETVAPRELSILPSSCLSTLDKKRIM